ncbi:MAG: SurA N-terminal domain-containing protein [Amaricoccus sp.]
MLNLLRAKHSRMLVWTLLVLIVVGLAGFGIGNSGAFHSSKVATVGDESIDGVTYARAMERELRAVSGQIGRSLPMSEARQYNLPNLVLAQLVNDAALDNEASRLSLSTGDGAVRDQLLSIQAFRGADGKFDRATYLDMLKRNGLDPAIFESDLRHEATRALLAGSVEGPVADPKGAAAALLAYVGERRSFDWLAIGPSLLPEPVPAPTDADIAAQYGDHPDLYTRPETRQITYVSLAPEVLAASIEVPEADLRAAYDAAPDRFNTPEKRILDRIGFPTDADAAAARARLDAGSVDFDALATERGLSAAQIDQGAVAADALGAEARAAVFGAGGPGIVGPVPTPLGPSLYRINAILAASNVPFEAARDQLHQERALKLAADKITSDSAAVEDLIAGGATLEEIASETDLKLGTVALNAETTGGVADDAAFRTLAAKADPGSETDLTQLGNGGIVSLRVDRIDPPALLPLDQVRDKVAADWTAGETARRLTALAQGFAKELEGGLAFTALASRLQLVPQAAGPVARAAQVPGVPAATLADIFAAPPRGTVVAADGASALLAQVTEIAPFDLAASDNQTIVTNAETQLRGQVAGDVLALYTSAVRNQVGVAVNQSQIDAALARFP